MENKHICITGGTGSFAGGLIDRLLAEDVREIKVIARSEAQLVALKAHYQGECRVIPLIGDIRDKRRMIELTRGSQIIFHLAALKHVAICEEMPGEAVLTNITGTQNIIDSAIINHVEKVVYVSTDKAVSPSCAYGSSKLIGEKLALVANGLSQTKFIVFRCGNLFASSGSVVPVFMKQVKKSRSVMLTDERMTRFFIPIEKAADILVEACRRGDGGEIFLPRMGALKIYDIAKYIVYKEGLDESQIKHIGRRPGEKMDEEMVTEEEAKHIYRMSDTLCVVLPNEKHGWIQNGFIEKDRTYPVSSKEAIMDYQEASLFMEKHM